MTRTGAQRIAVERARQVQQEDYGDAHDDEQNDMNEIAWAAVCYAAPEPIYRKYTYAKLVSFDDPWPWDEQFDKRPHSGNVFKTATRAQRIRLLEKAGALCAAEIDRLLRKGARGAKAPK